MKSYKKFLLNLLFVLFFIILFFISAYSFLIFKPNKALSFIDKFLVHEYSINTKFISSDNNSFLKPKFVIKHLKIYDQADKQALDVAKLNIGIDILRTLKDKELFLTNLEIKLVKMSENSNNALFIPISINGERLNVSNNEFNISAKKFNFLIDPLSIKVLLTNGNLNSYPYKKIKSFLDIAQKKIFYSSFHEVDSSLIKQIVNVNVDSMEDYSVNLNFETKGFINLETNESRRLDKLRFYDSFITTKSGFQIKNIQTTLHSGSDDGFYGLFQSELPDQKISGSVMYNNSEGFIRTELALNMEKIFNSSPYFKMSGNEIFSSVLKYSNNTVSIELDSDLKNTRIFSSIDEIKKNLNEKLNTSIYIEDISKPSYKIKNNLINASISSAGSGFFHYGGGLEQEINQNNYNEGLYIYLNLNSLRFNDISFDFSGDDVSKLKSIKVKAKNFHIFKNKFSNVYFDVAFKNQTKITVLGEGLNGVINIDDTNFIKVDLKDSIFDLSNFEFGSTNELNNINLRFIGKRIQAGKNLIKSIDFYLLQNKNILTIDNIKVDSKRLIISPGKDNDKAYISYNKKLDLYKIKGKYRLDNSTKYFDDLTKYNFQFLQSDLNIQWNSLSTLTNLEGRLDFLIKDLNPEREIADSTFLRALRILNLNGIVDGLDDASNGLLNINRASGKIIVGKNRALITKPVILETDEASMKWNGEVLKNKDGELNKLNLDLSMRLKISENMPWYAAIFGGIPAIAGTVVIEKLFEDSIQNATTINFDVNGSIDEPEIKRLN